MKDKNLEVALTEVAQYAAANLADKDSILISTGIAFSTEYEFQAKSGTPNEINELTKILVEDLRSYFPPELEVEGEIFLDGKRYVALMTLCDGISGTDVESELAESWDDLKKKIRQVDWDEAMAELIWGSQLFDSIQETPLPEGIKRSDVLGPQ